MKLTGVIIVVGVAAVLTAALLYSAPSSSMQTPKPALPIDVQPATSTPEHSVSIHGATVTVDIAETAPKRTQGLSGRYSLGEENGMLFVFDVPLVGTFWMKDMLFPIDIIWISNDKKVLGIEQNVSPITYPEIFISPAPVMYVLEVNALWAEQNGVLVGDEVTLSVLE